MHPRCRRVTSRSAGYDCVNNATVCEGRRPKNRPYEKGRLGPQAGIPKRLRPNCHCKSKRSRGVGTLRVGRPADYLPSGTVGGQWPPATGQWWTVLKGRRPQNRPRTPGLASQRERELTATGRRYTQISVGCNSAPSGRRATVPGKKITVVTA